MSDVVETRPELDEFAVDPAPHLVTDEELQRLLAHDTEERARDRVGNRRFLTAAAVSGIGLAVIALVVAVFAVAAKQPHETVTTVTEAVPAPAGATAAAQTGASEQPAPTLAQAKGVRFEPYRPVNPTVPAIPAGAVKRFKVGVMEHVTQVSAGLAPIKAWTYTVNGTAYRGTAASPPMVVTEGDKVEINFVNGASKSMGVTMPHSIDFHAAEVAPSKYYVDIPPGKSERFSFIAKHPGVFMYHCATQPVAMHTGAGMSGMMIVRPRGLTRVDKELWLTQQEFYIGEPGGLPDMAKVQAERPDVIAFNGYADQYKTHPITIARGERVRIFVMNAGPSKWSAFHVIGTVFDTTHVEGVVGHDSQTVNLAPSQGGWVEFTLDQKGNYPFVTHSFGDMVKGAAGVLHTPGAPLPKVPGAPTMSHH